MVAHKSALILSLLLIAAVWGQDRSGFLPLSRVTPTPDFIHDSIWYGYTDSIENPENAQTLLLGRYLFVLPSDGTVIDVQTGQLLTSSVTIFSSSETFTGSDGSNLHWVVAYDPFTGANPVGTPGKALLINEHFHVLKEHSPLPESERYQYRWYISSSSESSFMIHNEEWAIIVSPKNDSGESYEGFAAGSSTWSGSTTLEDGRFAILARPDTGFGTYYATIGPHEPPKFSVPAPEMFINPITKIKNQLYFAGENQKDGFLLKAIDSSVELLSFDVVSFPVSDGFFGSISLRSCNGNLIVSQGYSILLFSPNLELIWSKTVNIQLLNPVAGEFICEEQSNAIFMTLAYNEQFGLLKLTSGTTDQFGGENFEIEVVEGPTPTFSKQTASSKAGGPSQFDSSFTIPESSSISSVQFTAKGEYLSDGSRLPAKFHLHNGEESNSSNYQ